MPKPPSQCDFDIHEVDLPRAVVRTSEAPELVTRWVMRLTFVMLFVLAVLCLVGSHIPSGE